MALKTCTRTRAHTHTHTCTHTQRDAADLLLLHTPVPLRFTDFAPRLLTDPTFAALPPKRRRQQVCEELMQHPLVQALGGKPRSVVRWARHLREMSLSEVAAAVEAEEREGAAEV